MTYNAGQFNEVIPFIEKPPDWLILGGPADGDEAQCARVLWPSIKVIGIEPIIDNIDWQFANGWPKDDPLLLSALGATLGNTTINVPDDKRAASCLTERPGIPQSVDIVSIDFLNQVYGPFTNAILWLDIEGWEYNALQGATGLFSSGEIQLVNLEILERLTDHTSQIEGFFEEYGFHLAHVWNEQPGLVQDRVYVKD